MSRREFSRTTKLKAFERAKGRCEECGHYFQPIDRKEFDHIVPDALKGLNDLENCRVLCVPCHKDKTDADKAQIAKADRQRATHQGFKTPAGRPLPGTKASGIKMKFGGGWEYR